MKTNNFAPNSNFPFSRDYAITLVCKNKKCYLNANDRCVSPSSVAINSKGKCELYSKQVEKGIL